MPFLNSKVDNSPHPAVEVTSAFFPPYIGRHLRRYAYVYMYKLVFPRIYVYLHVSTRIYVYLHVYTCVSAYLHVSTRIYVYLLYVYLRVHVIVFLRSDG
jgi:hypothetical protein